LEIGGHIVGWRQKDTGYYRDVGKGGERSTFLKISYKLVFANIFNLVLIMTSSQKRKKEEDHQSINPSIQQKLKFKK
jgi:hypothetical protein